MPKGRPPKPYAQAWLAGDAGGHKRYRTEPTPPDNKPVAPDYLDEIARAEWDHITALLDDMGLLSSADRTSIELYCNSYSRYRKAQAAVAKIGSIIKSKEGTIYHSPYAHEMTSMEKACRTWLIEFGLTPAARARMSLPVRDSGSKPGILKMIS